MSNKSLSKGTSISNIFGNLSKVISFSLGRVIDTALISDHISLSRNAYLELEKVDTFEFDIFKFREYTNGHELESILPIILARHNLITSNKIVFANLVSFTRMIAMGYRQITYHN